MGKAVAPWPDFVGHPIHAGDVLIHPNGDRGVVLFISPFVQEGYQWRVAYDDIDYSEIVRSAGEGCWYEKLWMQIGEKGKAVVATAISNP